MVVRQSFGTQFAIVHDSTRGAAALTFRGLSSSRRVAFLSARLRKKIAIAETVTENVT